jgi:hypothetical protein
MKSKLKKKNDLNFKLILLTLFLLEIVACYYAYYTLGEVKQFFSILILSLNIIPFILCLYRIKIISFVIGLIIGLILIPYQILLVVKWFELKKESSTIVEYIYSYQKENGEFPECISDYDFENHQLTNNFSYYLYSKDFVIQYYIGTKGTTHSYYHKSGKWEYYPD